jgi:hypothetical protein
MQKKFSRSEIPLWSAYFLLVLGLVLFLLAWQLKQTNGFGGRFGEEFFPLSLAFGACFSGLGLYFLGRDFLVHKANTIPEHWHAAEATSVHFEYGSPGALPGKITASWVYPQGRQQKVQSIEIGFDPRPFFVAQMTVRYDPARPKTAKLDLQFLPKTVFVPWQVVLYNEALFLANLKAEGAAFAAAFAGFLSYGTLEDEDYDQCLAIFQWLDPASTTLYVFEGFMLINEKEPFPNWEPGMLFSGWMMPGRPKDFFINRQPN